MKVVDDAIQALFDGGGGAALRAIVGDGGLYYTETSQRPGLPYVRFDEVNASTERVFGGKQTERLVYQFTIFTDKETTDQLESIWLLFVALYDDASLTISGYNDMAMLRESHAKLKIAGQWKLWVRYRIDMEET